MFKLGLCYYEGDWVEQDKVRGSALFKKAAEAGEPRAKYSYGLDLFYGSNGMEQNQEEGVRLVEEALAGGVDYAEGALRLMRASLLPG